MVMMVEVQAQESGAPDATTAGTTTTAKDDATDAYSKAISPLLLLVPTFFIRMFLLGTTEAIL